MRRALEDLQPAGTSDLVVIPFILSDTDPVLQRVKASLPAYGYTRPITWAPPMADSYLMAQVVVDRAMALSQDPEHEQVMVLGFGATDAANERAVRSDLNKLVDYLSRYQRFRESRALIYYDRAAPNAEEKNQLADAVMTQMAAKKGRPLAVLATLGPKFDHSMGLASWLRQKFNEFDVTFAPDNSYPSQYSSMAQANSERLPSSNPG